MSTRKTTFFYAILIAVASIAVGMVIASRLDLSPRSEAQTLRMAPVNTAPITGPLNADTWRNIAKAVNPAVVNIRTESRQRGQDLTDFFGGGDDLFHRFFGIPGPEGQTPRQQRPPRDQVAVAAGTGFIIDKSGLILTNNHVIEGATKIEVFLSDELDVGRKAKVVGRDQLTDSALIELIDKPTQPLAEAKLGDSAQMQPGDWVMAIGNPFNLSHTVSVGVISATKRPFPVAEQRSLDVLQTDAAINPGNSGGPLINLRGEVIGINSAIYTDQGRGANIGIGFAIPINTVRDLLPQLKVGKVTRGRMGVLITDVPRDALSEFGLKERRGALVSQVTPNGPAAAAGVEPGDIILEYNGKPVQNRDDLIRMVVDTKPGTTVPIKVLRNKQERTLEVRVEELNLADEGNQPEQGSEQDTSAGFGMTLGTLTSDMARRLRLPAGTKGAVVTDVDPAGAAAGAGIQEGDVILQVNHVPVATAGDASRELGKVKSGTTAFLLVSRGGQEAFLTVRKE